MRKIAFCLLMFCAVSSLSAQNMNRYITITAPKGSKYYLDFFASAAQPVKVVNGSTSETYMEPSGEDITVEDGVVTVYGDMTYFSCSGDGVSKTVLDLSHNTALTSLYCSGCCFSTLDVSKNTALKYLECEYNGLTSLDVSKNAELVHLDCSDNELSSLDVSKNAALVHLDCGYNELSSLDVSNNAALANLDCGNNELSLLDVSRNTGLVQLICSDNNLSSLDISKNRALEYLSCGDNELSSLYVGNNAMLTHLYCFWNNISSLDVSKNTMLAYLNCSVNKILTLDLEKNRELKGLFCSNTCLNSLDLAKNTKLTALYCYSNKFVSLDLSKNTALEILECDRCELHSLDLSNNAALRYLSCYGNHFTSDVYDKIMCDLPFYTKADAAFFYPLENSSDSNYSKFMASNANNAKAKGWTVKYGGYGGDEVPFPATQGKYICPPEMGRYVTMGVKVGKEIKLSLSSRAASVAVRVVCGSLDTTLVVSNSGKEFKFTASAGTVTVYGNLFIFSCSNNGSNITSLDVSNNAELVRLVCENNRITGLDLSKNSGLRALACNGNPFTTGAYDDMMCSLPDVTDAGGGALTPLKDSLDDRYSTFMAANSANATDKGWRVLYRTGLRDIPATSGSYGCPGVAVRETTVESAVRVWPNPARTQLHIAGAAGELRVHDLTGRVVYRAEAGDDEIVVNIADWAKGMYFVRSGRQILKFVKE